MATDYTSYTDAQLDQAYADAVNSHDPNRQPEVVAIANVITSREQSPLYVGEMATGLFASKFPQYDALTHFDATQTIQSALSQHASQVSGQISGALSTGLFDVMKATAPLWIAGGVVLAIVLAIELRK